MKRLMAVIALVLVLIAYGNAEAKPNIAISGAFFFPGFAIGVSSGNPYYGGGYYEPVFPPPPVYYIPAPPVVYPGRVFLPVFGGYVSQDQWNDWRWRNFWANRIGWQTMRAQYNNAYGFWPRW